jgi:hypothetical protein
VNAFKRLHGLILGWVDESWDSAAASAAGGADRHMTNRPVPRRGRGAAGPRGRPRRIPRPAPTGIDRLNEGSRMNPPTADPDIRHDLVSRVRQEIHAGTYDSPEKLEAALDRLADRLDLD